MNNQNLKSKNNVRVVKNGKKKIIIKRKVPKNKNFKIKTPRKRETEISWEETIYNVSSTTDFFVKKIPIQPGLLESFSWLSKECANWEYYRFEHIMYQYVPAVNMVSQDAVGNVILSFDSDPEDAPPSSLLVAQNATKKAYAAPWKNIGLFLNSKDLNKMNSKSVIRTGPVPYQQSIKLYDSGNFYVSTSGQVNDGTNLGTIKAKYVVKLFNPEVKTTNLSANSIAFVGTGTAIITPDQQSSNVNVAIEEVIANGLDVQTVGEQTIFPPGKYNITARTTFAASSGFHLTSAYTYATINGTLIPLVQYGSFIDTTGNGPSAVPQYWNLYYESSIPFTLIYIVQSSDYTTNTNIGVYLYTTVIRVG